VQDFANGVVGCEFTEQNFRYLFDRSHNHPFNQRALDWYTHQFIRKVHDPAYYGQRRISDEITTFDYVRRTIQGQMPGYTTAWKKAVGSISAQQVRETLDRNGVRSRCQNVSSILAGSSSLMTWLHNNSF
jgi:hypothetical protein